MIRGGFLLGPWMNLAWMRELTMDSNIHADSLGAYIAFLIKLKNEM